jgi:hypothetical protein
MEEPIPTLKASDVKIPANVDTGVATRWQAINVFAEATVQGYLKMEQDIKMLATAISALEAELSTQKTIQPANTRTLRDVVKWINEQQNPPSDPSGDWWKTL